MAGTRLWISAIILAELVILALLSLYYGLCVQNDDLLCHVLEGTATTPDSLRPLTRPSWWSTTLHIHLIVEQEPSSESSLYEWSNRLEEWMKTSQLEDLPYFGQTDIHMNVVPTSDELWERRQNATKIVENSLLWTYLPERPSSDMGSASLQKDLDWLIYVPSKTHLDQLVGVNQDQDPIPSWLAWTRRSLQLVTVSTGVTEEPEMTSLLTTLVGPWLENTLDDSSDGPIPNGMSENEYLRHLQFTWQKAIMQDFDEWKRHLTRGERKQVFLELGKTSSQSLSTRLESLLEVRSILEDALERNQSRLTPEFPLEHYAAVFLPLLFPLLMPFLTSFVKELKRFKEKAKKKHEKAKLGSTSSEAKATDTKVSQD